MTDDPMYVVAYAPEGMDSGHVYLNRALDGSELMDARMFADEIARTYDREIEAPSGYVPDCCGDLRIEFLDHAPRLDACGRYLGSTRIWSGDSFYFKLEG